MLHWREKKVFACFICWWCFCGNRKERNNISATLPPPTSATLLFHTHGGETKNWNKFSSLWDNCHSLWASCCARNNNNQRDSIRTGWWPHTRWTINKLTSSSDAIAETINHWPAHSLTGRGLYSPLFREKPPEKKLLLFADFIKKLGPFYKKTQFWQSLQTQKPKGQKMLLTTRCKVI